MTATKNFRVESFVGALAIKAPCKVVTNTNITLSGEQTVNGTPVVAGDRVLVKDQTVGSENGIYNAETSAWQRAGDFDGERDVVRGTLVVIPSSTGNDFFYQVTTADPITIGTTAITFALAPLISFPKTAAETAATVTPVDFSFPEGHVSRYGTTVTAIQNAINVMVQVGGGEVIVPAGTFAFGTTVLDIPTKIKVRCAGRGVTNFTYSGTAYAITCLRAAGAGISDFTLTLSNDAGGGIRHGDAARRCEFTEFEIFGTNAAANTGTGFWFDGADSVGTAFSGGTTLENYYILGQKTSIRVSGVTSGTETWTAITSINGWLIGRSAGIITGSRGIHFDTNSNGVGSKWVGGTIEAQAVAIKVENGVAVGFWYQGDLEGNTVDWELGNSFNGRIDAHNGNKFIEQGTNAATNRWMGETHLFGVWSTHSRNFRIHTFHLGSSLVQKWGLQRESTENDPDSVRNKFLVATGSGGDPAALRNYMRFLDYKINYAEGSILPTVGAYHAGSQLWKRAPAASASPGWVCVTTGTFGAASDTTGDTDGSTGVITGMTSTAAFTVGDYVNVSGGFAAPTAPHKLEILEIPSSTSIRLDANSTSVQANVTVDTTDPVFEVMSSLAPATLPVYTPTNDVTDRVWNANAAVNGTGIDVAAVTGTNVALLSDHDALVAVVQELSDVLATLTKDLKTQGITG